jgi:hypothetical protein
MFSCWSLEFGLLLTTKCDFRIEINEQMCVNHDADLARAQYGSKIVNSYLLPNTKRSWLITYFLLYFFRVLNLLILGEDIVLVK